MASSGKEIKRRIKSVKNIAQITKAMELVSAAKMRKSQAQAQASRPYAQLSGELLKHLTAKLGITAHPLIQRVLPEDNHKPAEKTLVILMSSDRGLAGALNTNVINKALSLLKHESKEKFDLITIGKKGSDAARRFGYNIVATFDGKDKNTTITDIYPVSHIVVNDYLDFKYEKVFIVYTDFVSTLVQKPSIVQLLPFEVASKEIHDDFVFEPGPGEVLGRLVYRVLQFTIYQALVEAVASEHSARMVAMRNANESAQDLINELTLSYNQARQASITKELAEISAAKLAMED